MENLDHLQAFEDELEKWRPIWLRSYDDGIPLSYEYEDKPVKWWYNKWAEETPDKPYIFAGDTVLSYKFCNDMSRRFANALSGIGIKKGDRVAVMAPNVPQYVIAVNGLLKIGAIEVPANVLYTVPELTEQFNDSGTETVVVMAAFAPKAIAMMKDPGCCVKRVIAFQIPGAPAEVEQGDNIYDMDTLCRSAPATEPDVESLPEDIIRLQYTGGTTGVPKGCIITNRMAYTQGYRCSAWCTKNYDLIAQEDMRFLGAVPLNHIYGWNFTMNVSYVSGGSFVLVAQPKPDELLKAIVKHSPNIFCTIPAMLIGLISHPEIKSGNADISCIKSLFCGSAPLPVSVRQEFKKLTGSEVIEGYGLSESTNILTGCSMRTSKDGSCGIPLPDVDILIVDVETGTEVMPEGDTGEIIARGSQNITSYWNNPEETAHAVRNGWLYTGDIGKFDEDGFLFLLDRKKDVIIVSGFNVFPREIDELVFAHPKVKEACAVGLPHPTKGECIKLLVSLNDGESLSAEELLAYCRKSLAPYKIPSEVEFVAELPRTNVGKVDRKTIKEMETAKLMQPVV